MTVISDELVLAFQGSSHNDAVSRVIMEIRQGDGVGGYRTVNGNFYKSRSEEILPPLHGADVECETVFSQ